MSSKPEDFTSDEVVNGGFKTEAGGKTDFFTQKTNNRFSKKLTDLPQKLTDFPTKLKIFLTKFDRYFKMNLK